MKNKVSNLSYIIKSQKKQSIILSLILISGIVTVSFMGILRSINFQMVSTDWRITQLSTSMQFQIFRAHDSLIHYRDAENDTEKASTLMELNSAINKFEANLLDFGNYDFNPHYMDIIEHIAFDWETELKPSLLLCINLLVSSDFENFLSEIELVHIHITDISEDLFEIEAYFEEIEIPRLEFIHNIFFQLSFIITIIVVLFSSYLVYNSVKTTKSSAKNLDLINKSLNNLINERTSLVNELTRSNHDLGEFAYIASHDLKEPLRSISSYLTLLEKKYTDNLGEKGQKYLKSSLKAANHMDNLIEDLLTYSQVGVKEKNFTSVNVDEVIKSVLQNIKHLTSSNKAVISWNKLPIITADTVQLKQLFQNLLSNAIKFRTEKKPVIEIKAIKNNDFWIFSIEDNGIGIDSKNFDEVFIVFKRLHSREKYEGTGIGLSVCKKIVEKHGGKIWIESELGKGSKFLFSIPVINS